MTRPPAPSMNNPVTEKPRVLDPPAVPVHRGVKITIRVTRMKKKKRTVAVVVLGGVAAGMSPKATMGIMTVRVVSAW